MANYPQPPYGMSFQMPPQPPQHPAPNQQAGPPDPRQVPNVGGYQYDGSLTGLNLHSYAQNIQQPQYQPQYWPPPPLPVQNAFNPNAFPPPFVSQNGIPFPPPPPPAGSSFYTMGSQPPVQNAPPPKPAPAFPTPSSRLPIHLPPTPRARFGPDSDKEDGEVSESDAMLRPSAAPRSVPSPHTGIAQAGAGRSARPPDASAAGHLNQKTSLAAAEPTYALPVSRSNRVDLVTKRGKSLEQLWAEADQFVMVLHANNVPFSLLVNEGLDAQALGDMYRRLGLLTGPEPSPALKPNESSAPMQAAPAPTAPVPTAPAPTASSLPKKPPAQDKPRSLPSVTISNAKPAQAKPAPVVKTTVSSNPPTKSAPSPIDRKDYIARLQAAKMGKQAVATKVTPPQKTPPAPEAAEPAAPRPAGPSPNVAQKLPAAKDPVSEEERRKKTELIRQKLEAMKAAKQQASTQNASQIPKSTASVPSLDTAPFSSPLKLKEQPPEVPSVPFQSEPNMSNGQKPQLSNSGTGPRIPGLFMSSSSTGDSPGQSLGRQITPQSARDSELHSRKRPVASDFDGVSTPRGSGPAFTRPLGQSPHEHDDEPMIIEVSEDESGGSEMDLEEDEDPPKQPSVASPPTSSRNTQQSLRTFPPLSNFPSRPASVKPPSSALSTPPVPQPNASLSHQEKLAKTERDLEIMRQKIAAYDQKKKEAESRKREMARAASVQKDTAALSTQLPTPAKVAPAPSPVAPAMSKNRKRPRSTEPESDPLPVEPGRMSENARVAAIRKQFEELGAKLKLVQELESLGIDTEGMSHAELQAKKASVEKAKATEQLTEKVAASNNQGPQGPGPVIPNEPPLPTDEIRGGLEEPNSRETHVPSNLTEPSANKPVDTESPASGEDMVMSDVESHKAPSPPAAQVSVAEQVQIFEPSPHALQSAAVDVVTGISGVSAAEDLASPVDDEEDFYSREPTVPTALVEGPKASELEEDSKKHPPETAKSPSEEGEVEMDPSSASDDPEHYEPAGPTLMATSLAPPLATQGEDAVEEVVSSPASSSSASSTSSSSEDMEVYEPPDAGQEDGDVQLKTAGPISSPDAASSRKQSPSEAMDLAATSPEDVEFPEQTKESSNSMLISSQGNSIATGADDLAPQKQPRIILAEAAPATEPASDRFAMKPARFVPYKSPLQHFKSYRYHPCYLDEVSGGFLSMTHSHQIDPEKVLCRYEAMGANCNDPSCDSQHFRDMGISGDKILVQLGTANPGKTTEEKQKWNDGLRLVLKELRQRNIKDPNIVALEIAKYRRQFLNDETRVVNF